METNDNKEEQILIRITGKDRPGLTASIMEILARKDAKILDIGQADIHSTLSLGILIRIDDHASGQVMKELLFKATELGVNIGFSPVTDEEYENWVNLQGKNRYILTMIGRTLSAKQIEAATKIIARQGLNIDSILRLTGRMSIMHPERNMRACIEFSRRPGHHAEGANGHKRRDGDRLLVPERRHVPTHASTDLLRHGLYAHTDRMYRRAG